MKNQEVSLTDYILEAVHSNKAATDIVEELMALIAKYDKTHPQNTEEWINARVKSVYERIQADISEMAIHVASLMNTSEGIVSPMHQALSIYNYLFMKVCRSIDSDYSTYIVSNGDKEYNKVYVIILEPYPTCRPPFKIYVGVKEMTDRYMKFMPRECIKEYLNNFGVVRSQAEYIVAIKVVKNILMDLSARFYDINKLPIGRYPIA